MKNTNENPAAWMHAMRARKRLLKSEFYRDLDAKAREGISDEDYATTMATLETMARNLGWDESHGIASPHPFGPGPRMHGWRGRRHPFMHGRRHGHGDGTHRGENAADV